MGRKRIWMGYAGSNYELFRSAETPTSESHPQYSGVTGPFSTLRGAKFMLHFGHNNPHCQSVSDAERIAKQYNYDYKSMPEKKALLPA